MKIDLNTNNPPSFRDDRVVPLAELREWIRIIGRLYDDEGNEAKMGILGRLAEKIDAYADRIMDINWKRETKERDDNRAMVYALMIGWTVDKRSLYDEEGIEGWVWNANGSSEFAVTGSWDEMPTWSDAAHLELLKQGYRER